MSQRYRVIISDFITGDLGTEERMLGDLAEIVALGAYTEQDLVGKIEDADAMALLHQLGERAAAQNLEVIRVGRNRHHVQFLGKVLLAHS